MGQLQYFCLVDCAPRAIPDAMHAVGNHFSEEAYQHLQGESRRSNMENCSTSSSNRKTKQVVDVNDLGSRIASKDTCLCIYDICLIK